MEGILSDDDTSDDEAINIVHNHSEQHPDIEEMDDDTKYDWSFSGEH